MLLYIYDIEKGKKQMNWRKIFVISIVVICILSINLAVFLTIIEKEDKSDLPEEVIVDTVALTENFESIFDNSLDYQKTGIAVNKIDQNKEIIYTQYQKEEKKENQYDISINIPRLNINNENANKINEEINNIFYNKINSILIQNGSVKTIYTVSYKAYINDNILSLIIRSTLKEDNNAQRLIIKTYNYNLSSNELLNLDKVIEYRNLNRKAVQDKIINTIESAANTASVYQELGYNKYLRNKNDSMYLVENTKVFFIGEGKSVYIIYPYGNSNYTSEMDLLVM